MSTDETISIEDKDLRAQRVDENLRFLLEGNQSNFGRFKCESHRGNIRPSGKWRTIEVRKSYEFDDFKILVTVANSDGIGAEFGDMTEFGTLSVEVNNETMLECTVTKGRGMGGEDIYSVLASSGVFKIGKWTEALDVLVKAIKDHDAAEKVRRQNEGKASKASKIDY